MPSSVFTSPFNPPLYPIHAPSMMPSAYQPRYQPPASLGESSTAGPSQLPRNHYAGSSSSGLGVGRFSGGGEQRRSSGDDYGHRDRAGERDKERERERRSRSPRDRARDRVERDRRRFDDRDGDGQGVRSTHDE
jgi:hypothetical protein